MIRVIGHRGASRAFPENTRAAFDQALAEGADGLELDVQLSRDGAPVVWHDRTLQRAGGGRLRVARLDAADLVRLDPGAYLDSRFAGQHILTLEQVLDEYAGRTRLLVEIKAREGFAAGRHRELAERVATMIRRSRRGNRIHVLAFDRKWLDVCATAAPGVGRVLNLRPPRRLGARLAAALPDLAALSLDVRSITPAFTRAARARGVAIWTYTANTRATVERSVACGASAVMSDRPGWLRAELARLAP